MALGSGNLAGELWAHVCHALGGTGEYVWHTLRDTPWTDWHGFWLRHVLDDRFLVFLFLPLVGILLLTPRRHLRAAIILTGLLFLGYVFGAFYALFWLLLALAFYAITQWYAREVCGGGPSNGQPGNDAAGESRRPTARVVALIAIAIITFWYLFALALQWLPLPAALNGWLFAHLPWLYPMGARSLSWQLYSIMPEIPPSPEARLAPSLVKVALIAPMTNGQVIFVIRLVQYFSALARGEISAERRTLTNWLAWICYGPALMQGPLERFNVFQEELDTCHERRCWRNVARGFGRIGLGLSKSLFSTLFLYLPLAKLYDPVTKLGLFWHPELVSNYWLLLFGTHLGMLWLFLEFSGYCDISAGMAHLLGYRQIENFDRPYFATSVRDFWRRWHISLSFTARDYVYFPLCGSYRWPLRNLCITFVVIGLLHNLAPTFVLWGAVMGTMVYVNHRWSRWMKRVDKERGPLAGFRRACLRLQPLPRLVAWLLTLNALVASSLIVANGPAGLRVLWEIVRRPIAALAAAWGS